MFAPLMQPRKRRFDFAYNPSNKRRKLRDDEESSSEENERDYRKRHRSFDMEMEQKPNKRRATVNQIERRISNLGLEEHRRLSGFSFRLNDDAEIASWKRNIEIAVQKQQKQQLFQTLIEIRERMQTATPLGVLHLQSLENRRNIGATLIVLFWAPSCELVRLLTIV